MDNPTLPPGIYQDQINNKQISLPTEVLSNAANSNPTTTAVENHNTTIVDIKKKDYFSNFQFKNTITQYIKQIISVISSSFNINFSTKSAKEKDKIYRLFFLVIPLSKVFDTNIQNKENQNITIRNYAQIHGLDHSFISSMQLHRKSHIVKYNLNSKIKQVLQKFNQYLNQKKKGDFSRFKYIEIILILSCHFSNINIMQLCGCQIQDDSLIPYYLNNYHHTIKELDISDNKITIEFLKQLKPTLKNLTSLNLACMPTINNDCIQFLRNQIPQCISLDLSYTDIDSQGVNFLENLNLKYLGLWTGTYNPNRYYHHFQFGKNEKPLTELKLTAKNKKIIEKMKLRGISTNLYFQDASDLVLSLDNQVEYIQIGGKLNQQAVQKIQNSMKLQRVYLVNSTIPKIRSEKVVSYMVISAQIQQDLEFILQLKLKYLRSLSLIGQKINDSYLDMLFKLNPPSLQSINLSKSKITNEGIYSLIKFPNIIWIDLCESAIQNLGVSNLMNNLKKLKTLKISKCDISKISIDKQNKQFYSLVAYFNNLTDDSVQAIVKNLKNIQNLELGTNLITNKGLKLILTNLHNLKYLDLRNNKIKLDSDPELKQLYKQKSQIYKIEI